MNDELNRQLYRVGTLTYTRKAILMVLFWMLWADLCLSIMESVPALIPLQLKWLGASDKIVGLLSGSLSAILSVMLCPIIGMQSDRHRSPLGRRRPFLLWATPCLVLSLILLGFSGPLTTYLHRLVGDWFGGISADLLGIALIGVFAFSFYFFNTYIIQIYQYLFADVIPQEVMGKFVGLYRGIGALGGFIFNRWLLGLAEQGYTWALYGGSALLYGAAFMLLVWRVKEGDYPPPETGAHTQRLPELIRQYCRECFVKPFYLKIYIMAMFYWTAWVSFNTFVIIYATRATGSGYSGCLGMSLDNFGKVKGWTLLLQVPIFFLIGPLMDRFHPLRILLAGLIGILAVYVVGMFAISGTSTFFWWWVANAAATAVFSAAYLAIFPRLLPQAKFGQYFSANQIFFSCGVVLAPILCGALLDQVKNYNVLFIWAAFFTALSLLVALSLYRHWKRLGGDSGYVAPV